MKNRIVFAHDTNKLETDVNIFMENGWKPIGGLAISKQDAETHYFQTMIYSPAPKPPGKG